MTLCEHCGEDIAIRNPSGFCDHLYYPDSCDQCQLLAARKRYGNGEGLALSVEACHFEIERYILKFDSLTAREQTFIREAFEAGWVAREES